MPTPRRKIISLKDTQYYHCMSRVVRRAFLCGDDKYSGKNYDHRRDWVEKQLLKLTEIFAIDIAAYAVMSNHLHVILHIDVERVNNWSDKKVVDKWHKYFKGNELTNKFVNGEVIEAENIPQLKCLIAKYRSRLCDISWFMRCLNEPIARMANQEDDCTGRFWEGRFKSQALLDEAALLSCMAYVDLNPVRAKVAKSPEKSDYTSLKLRINAALNGKQPRNLLPFIDGKNKHQLKGINFSFKDYLSLIKKTCKVIQNDNFKNISHPSNKVLNKLNVSDNQWIDLSTNFGRLFHGPVGNIREITDYCEHLEKKRRHFAYCYKYISPE